MNWQQWVLAFFAIDFLSYWYHRFSHEINILWAGHVTHHSSELYNFSNGFRTSLFQGLNRILFWCILPIFGFSPFVLLVSLKVSGIYDFFLHTTYIPKLGFLEKILITPSMHRVHHGKNDIYIDKNYGSTLVVWDKIFGTYQEETEPVKYGIKSDYTDNNPVTAIGHHYIYLFKNIMKTPKWSDKIKWAFMPPDWKPKTIATQQTRSIQRRKSPEENTKNYALFQLGCIVPGFIFLMVFYPLMSKIEIALCALIAASTMYQCSLVFNNNAGETFETKEQIRLILGIFITLFVAIFVRKYYLWGILVYLIISYSVMQFSQARWRYFSH